MRNRRARAQLALEADKRAAQKKERMALALQRLANEALTNVETVVGTDAPLVLVTGATGYLGSHCVKLLLQAGYKVRGTVRSRTSAKTLALEQCLSPLGHLELTVCDLTSADGWDAAVSGCTFVLHVAAPVEPSEFYKDDACRYLRNDARSEKALNACVSGSVIVVDAAKRAGVKRVVLTSSLAAMMPKGNPCAWFAGSGKPGEIDRSRDWSSFVGTEATWTDEEFTAGYPLAKTRAEKAAWDAVRGSSMELSVLNPGVIWGPPLHPQLAAPSRSFLDLALRQVDDPRKEVAAFPAVGAHVCDVRDVALAHVKAMTLPKAANRRFPIVSSAAVLSDMAVTLSKVFAPMGYDCVTAELPGWLVKLVALVDPHVARLAFHWRSHMHYDDSALKDLELGGYIGIEQTMCDTVHANVEFGIYEKKPGYQAPLAKLQ
jgi:nucleoside-diphosphate-sugar epimerase